MGSFKRPSTYYCFLDYEASITGDLAGRLKCLPSRTGLLMYYIEHALSDIDRAYFNELDGYFHSQGLDYSFGLIYDTIICPLSPIFQTPVGCRKVTSSNMSCELAAIESPERGPLPQLVVTTPWFLWPDTQFGLKLNTRPLHPQAGWEIFVAVVNHHFRLAKPLNLHQIHLPSQFWARIFTIVQARVQCSILLISDVRLCMRQWLVRLHSKWKHLSFLTLYPNIQSNLEGDRCPLVRQEAKYERQIQQGRAQPGLLQTWKCNLICKNSKTQIYFYVCRQANHEHVSAFFPPDADFYYFRDKFLSTSHNLPNGTIRLGRKIERSPLNSVILSISLLQTWHRNDKDLHTSRQDLNVTSFCLTVRTTRG